MAFVPIQFSKLVTFNSSTSSEMLDIYENTLNNIVVADNDRIPSKSFAPSSMRCKRRSWFRLRGVVPDSVSNGDLDLYFRCRLGDACHNLIQSTLSTTPHWVDVVDYIKVKQLEDIYELTKNGYEYRISHKTMPIKFACDGILNINDKYYLLEIKSCEYSSFCDLTEPKSEHIDQIKTYCALLNIRDVLFMYIDRQSGAVKCYEVNVGLSDIDMIWTNIYDVLEAVNTNLAPEGLPTGDKWCSPSMCPYYNKCKEYGRNKL